MPEQTPLLSTDELCELRDRAQRIADNGYCEPECESRDCVYHVLAPNTLRLLAEHAAMRLALRNVRMLAARMSRKEVFRENAGHLLRFCEQGGEPRAGDILRANVPAGTAIADHAPVDHCAVDDLRDHLETEVAHWRAYDTDLGRTMATAFEQHLKTLDALLAEREQR